MKNTLKTFVLSILVWFTAYDGLAQQEAQFTQYLDNMLYYNPAYAGSTQRMGIAALHRQQWAGFEGAPMSTTLNFHTPLRYENVGIGLSVLNDKAGPINATWINGDVSYSLRFKNHNGRLSFGVKGGVSLLNGDITSLYKIHEDDDIVNIRYKNDAKFNIGAGIYYHSDQFFVGVAVPKIIDNIKDANQLIDPKYITQRHYYLTIGGYINANRMLKIRPSAMLKVTENAPAAIDANLAFIMYDKFWIGANYRILESAGVYAQYQISNQFKIGYAFEFSTGRVRSHNAGTHELMIAYDLILKDKPFASPRFF